MLQDMKHKAPSVNYHLNDACNMRCKFCFATFKDLGVVKHDAQKSKQIIQKLAEAGFEKITFAGGEPTLVKELPELIKYAKSLGLITCLVTNGQKLLEPGYADALIPNLDWLAVSIDSLNAESNLNSGRFQKGKNPLHEEELKRILNYFKGANVKIKINTVVSKFNVNEDLNGFILNVKPNRWKILQALRVDGQNTAHFGEFEVTNDEFQTFLLRHQPVANRISVIKETTELIQGSYIMVSPDGRFFDDTKGFHTYSDPILNIGVKPALEQVSFNFDKFLNRGGLYNWNASTKIKVKKKILLIDMDGVLAESNDIEFQNNKHNKYYFLNKKPITGAVESFKILSKHYECHIVSTPVWKNPHCWSEKRIWVRQFLGKLAFKRLTLTHNKQLVRGDIIIDDTNDHGICEFGGEHIHFGTEKFPDWKTVVDFLLNKAKNG
jgi:radical S-adenosyl methionine domain-containing protein 2